MPIHVGGGYGGDSDRIHGVWKGEKFTERLTYDMNDPAIIGRSGFGVIDHVGRAGVPRRRQGLRGLGPVQHGALGPARPVWLRRLADGGFLRSAWFIQTSRTPPLALLLPEF